MLDQRPGWRQTAGQFPGGQVFRDELNGHAGAYEQCCVLRKTGEELLCEANCCRSDGNRVSADLGIGAHLSWPPKTCAGTGGLAAAYRSALLGAAKRVFQLPQYLRFAEHHRVESAGDAENMSDGLVCLQREQGVAKGAIEGTFARAARTAAPRGRRHW